MSHTKGHLGGHLNLTHTDEGSLRFMIENFNIKTMLDVGCGPGGQIILAKNLGISAKGIDGFPGPKAQKDAEIILHDFSDGPYDHKREKFDLAWCCEFVEHVYEKYIDNYMNSFKSCKFVIMTFAPPGKLGHHHVNCRKQEYWIEVMKKNNLHYNREVTKQIRNLSTMKNDFIRKNGLFFTNTEKMK